MRIHLATDHAGFSHKNAIAEWLIAEGFAVCDYGADVFDASDDFTDYIVKAAHAVSKAPVVDRGIIFGGSGQGEAMLANRFPRVRATVLYNDDAEIVKLSREHNDANVLSIGARTLSVDNAKKHIWSWLHTSGPVDARHLRRIDKMEVLSSNLHT